MKCLLGPFTDDGCSVTALIIIFFGLKPFRPIRTIAGLRIEVTAILEEMDVAQVKPVRRPFLHSGNGGEAVTNV